MLILSLRKAYNLRENYQLGGAIFVLHIIKSCIDKYVETAVHKIYLDKVT